MTQPVGSAATATEVERRIVSVLFADLVGFTPLSERLDAEDVATIQDAYFAVVRETVGRYGGRLEKFIGDAAMAVFGLPRTRDDDAERAVRTGLALVAAVEQLGARLGLDEGELRLRVGINTGEVVHAVEGPDAGRITGDTVNTAARFQAATAPGTVLVGEDSALAVAESIEIEAIPPLELKGKAAAVRAFVATAVRPQRSRELAMGSLRAPTIGREREIERLVGRIAAIAGGGERATERWLLVAPPGVGKTRLVEEVVRRAELGQPGPVVRRMRLRPETSAAYAPLAPLAAAALTDAGVEAAASGVARLADRLARAGIERARARTVARELLDLAGATDLEDGEAAGPDRDQRFGAWLEGLDALAQRAELWIVEDLHWATPDLVAFIDRATATAAPRGRVIVATARPSFLEAAPGWVVEAARDGTEARGSAIELATLGPADAAGLVRALVGDALPDTLVDAIATRSDGNCLFIEELLRTWVGTGALVEADPGPDSDAGDEATARRWTLAVPAEQIPLPATVQAIYAAQLDDLPAEARQAARRGAVAGRRFPVRALATLGVGEPVRAVDQLRRRALVAGPLADPVAGDTFAYRHALLRDAGYASLARAERADLHVRLARWLEAAGGDDVERVAASVGDHLAAAVESAPGLAAEVVPGLTRAAVAAEAAAWLERAGDADLAAGAIATAAASYRRAAELTDGTQPADHSRRLTKLGRALAPTGGVEEAEDAFRRAIGSARRAREAGDDGWRERFAEPVEALAALLFERIRFVEAWHVGEDALTEMGDADDLPAARVRLARSRGRTGETNDATGWIADAERAVATAEALGEPTLAYEFRRDLMRARSEGGAASAEDWVAFRADAEANGDVATTVSARLMEAAYRADDDPRVVPAILAPARELAVARGLVERLGWLDHEAADAALGAGDWDAVLEAGLRGVEIGERHGYDRISVRSWAALLPAASLRGDVAVLEGARRWFDERAGRLPDSPYGRVLHAGAAAWMRAGGVGDAGGDMNVKGEVVDTDHLRPSFDLWLAMSGYEFVAATDAIVDAWLRAGHVDWVGQLIEAAGAATLPPDSPSVVGAAAFELTRVRHGLATDAIDAASAAARTRAAIGPLARIGIAYWEARGLRLLEELGAATPEELARREAIEGRLGVVRSVLD